MIKVHHLNNSRSQRVVWLLEELELPYEIVKYERDPATMLAPKSLERIHPLGKSQVIEDDGKIVAESAVILEHIVEKHGVGRMAPAPGTPAHGHYRYFMHYAEGSLMPYLLLKLIFGRIKAKAPFLVRPIAKKIANTVSKQFVDPNLVRHLTFIDDHLAKHTWFAGDELTAADIQMSFGCEAIVSRAGSMGVSVERVQKLVDTFRERPAYKRALDKGGPYTLE